MSSKEDKSIKYYYLIDVDVRSHGIVSWGCEQRITPELRTGPNPKTASLAANQ